MLLLRGPRTKWLRQLVGDVRARARTKRRPSTRLMAPVRPLDCVVRLEFQGQQPSGKNHQGRGRNGAAFGTKDFTAWRRDWAAQFQQQQSLWSPYFPIQEPVVVWATYTPEDERIRDVPGLEDAVWHLVEWVGCVKSDGLIREAVWRRRPVAPGAGGLILEVFPADWEWSCIRGLGAGQSSSMP